ncbi:MAG: hypothetical protein RI897_2099 [Verrucomicrobiota bacterium]
MAIEEDVILDLVITAAAEEDGALDVFEEVAGDGGAADTVVHVDAHGAHADAAGIVDEIMDDTVAAVGPIAAGVDGAYVAGFEGDVMDFVEFDAVVIAREEDGAMGMVVDEVVAGEVADAAELDGGDVAFGPPALVMEVVVLDEVGCGFEGGTVAAGEDDATVAGVEDIAVEDFVIGSSGDGDAVVTEVAEAAACDDAVAAVGDVDAVAASGLEGEAVESDMRSVAGADDGGIEEGDDGGGIGGVERGPEVELAGGGIDVIFARGIEFLEDVEEVEALAFAEAVEAMGRGGVDEAVVADGGDLFVGVGPVPGPVTVDPPVGGGLPAAGAGVIEEESAFELAELASVFIPGGGVFGDTGDGEPIAGIGPAGEGHGLSVGEQLQVGGLGGAAESPGREVAEILDALGGEVGDLDGGAGDGAEALEDGGVLEGAEADTAAAEEGDGFIFDVAVRDGAGFGATVLGGEFEGLPAGVGAAANPDGDAVFGEVILLAEQADTVAGAFESGERFRFGAFVGVFAVEGDPEFPGDFGGGYGWQEEGAAEGEAEGEQHGAGAVGDWAGADGFRRHGFIKGRGGAGGKGFCGVWS